MCSIVITFAVSVAKISFDYKSIIVLLYQFLKFIVIGWGESRVFKCWGGGGGAAAQKRTHLGARLRVRLCLTFEAKISVFKRG